ncbi:MAG TPA: ATP-binding cassette domain-containing protein [Chloroflexota bacterium]|nr:ATP-binding cassette domain-containing protein [Chloroflexota bacterium]
MSVITVTSLTKTFKLAKHHRGALGSLRNLLERHHTTLHAVQNISFTVHKGEMLGCLGPNGAGKSTTIKMLTGILTPTGGTVDVLGLSPQRNRKEVAARIGVVFGQRTQLWWDLPLIESLELLRHVYKVPPDRYRRNLNTFREILELDPFLDTPVRQLSLGQRMRGDLAAALLHDPEVLYLDEPTIGLDVVAKHRIRDFLRRINAERGVTVLLTTHDMADIEQLCPRVLIIDHGALLYDGALRAIRDRFGTERTLVVDLAPEDAGVPPIHLPHAAEVRSDGPRRWLSFDRTLTTASALISDVAAHYRLQDLTIEEPEIESIIRHIYERGFGAVRSPEWTPESAPPSSAAAP